MSTDPPRLTRRCQPLVSAGLAVLAVVLVLAAAGGFLPANRLPHVSDRVVTLIPHVNALIALTAIATIGYAWWSIRRGRIRVHRRAMGLALILFAIFLTLYVYRLTLLGGPTPFAGAELIYRFVYLPLLTVHILLAIVCIPLLFDALGLALVVPSQELGETRHPLVGRVAATLWSLSFGLGICVYLLLHWL